MAVRYSNESAAEKPTWFDLPDGGRSEDPRGVREGTECLPGDALLQKPGSLSYSSSIRRPAGCGPACPAVWEGGQATVPLSRFKRNSSVNYCFFWMNLRRTRCVFASCLISSYFRQLIEPSTSSTASATWSQPLMPCSRTARCSSSMLTCHVRLNGLSIMDQERALAFDQSPSPPVATRNVG